MTFKDKIELIIKMHNQDYHISEDKVLDKITIDALYQLHLEGVREIAEKMFYDLFQYENLHITKTDDDWLDEFEEIWRNNLRAEQRELLEAKK